MLIASFVISMLISILVGIFLWYILNLYKMSYPLELILKSFVGVMCFTPNVYLAHGFELLPTGIVLLAHLGLGWGDFVWIELVPIILGMIVTILAVHISRPQKVKSPENGS